MLVIDHPKARLSLHLRSLAPEVSVGGETQVRFPNMKETSNTRVTHKLEYGAITRLIPQEWRQMPMESVPVARVSAERVRRELRPASLSDSTESDTPFPGRHS
jgi:hypothetical protein